MSTQLSTAGPKDKREVKVKRGTTVGGLGEAQRLREGQRIREDHRISAGAKG